jgi:hypothetical protein
MLSLSRKLLCGLAFFVSATAVSASAAPVDSDLLRLVPAGAQIVSGIADPGTTTSTGRLLIVTKGNNLDYDDCLALLGVDGAKVIDAVIEAAASSSTSDLSDHLLLVAGQFDGLEIFKAALENGATRAEYNGEQILVVKPSDREKDSMSSVRWLAILKNRVLVFGVPGMAASALDRYARNEPADTILTQRIARLPANVNSWSIVAMPPRMLSAHLALQRVPASLETLLKDADEVELGVHYGRMAKISFSIGTHLDGSDGEGVFRPQQIRAQQVLASFSPEFHSHLHVGVEEQGRLHGWLTVSDQQLDQWMAAFVRSRSGSGDQRTGALWKPEATH